MEEAAELQRQLTEALDALAEMVVQYCTGTGGEQWDVGGLCHKADAQAMRILGKHGLLEVEDSDGRNIVGRWKT